MDGVCPATGPSPVTGSPPPPGPGMGRAKNSAAPARMVTGATASAQGVPIAGAPDPTEPATVPPAIGPVALARAILRLMPPPTRKEVTRAVIVACGV